MARVVPTPIPAVPTPVPSTTSPSNFDVRADAMMTSFPAMVDGINLAASDTFTNAEDAYASAQIASASAESAIGASGLSAITFTPMSFTLGTKAVVLQGVSADIDLQDGEAVYIRRMSNPFAEMLAVVDNRAGLNMDLVVTDAAQISGVGGPFNDWIVISARAFPDVATPAEIRAGVNTRALIAPFGVMASADFQPKADAATITFDFSAGWNWEVTLNVAGVTRLIANPNNTHPGMPFCIALTQNTPGGQAWTMGIKWIRTGGASAGSVGNGQVDYLVGLQLPNGYMLYDIISNPVT